MTEVLAVPCPLAGRCGGCPWLGRPLATQNEERRTALQTAWEEANAGPLPLCEDAPHPVTDDGLGLRDRTDLAYRNDQDGVRFALWSITDDALLDVGACPALTPALRAFLASLRLDPPPIARASLRLRVGPDGTRGLWVDAANVDILALLEQRQWLRDLLAAGVSVELGQRRKPVVDDVERPRLEKQTFLQPWFQTWGVDGSVFPVFTAVGGFTQPGLAGNRLLVDRVLALAQQSPAMHWLELGSGSGNFTLALASLPGRRVRCVETDPVAREGLLMGLDAAGVLDRVELTDASMHRNDARLQRLLQSAEAVLADPPRSGLGGLLDALEAVEPHRRPSTLLYISCFTASLASDAGRLQALGYRAKQVDGVDQFSHGPHVEWVVQFVRDPSGAPLP